MDQILKQRLIGASVLIALAIIFIPMVFETPNESSNQNISIEIPQEPQDLQQKTFSLDSNNKTERVVLPENKISQHQKVIEIVDNSPKEVFPNTVNDIKVVNNIPKEETSKPKEPKENITEKKIEEKKEIQPPKKATKPTKTVVESDNQSSYRVKLGVFTLEKNAQKLKAEIINQGLQAEVYNNKNRKLFEVYSNVFASKKIAQSYVVKILSLKLKIGKPTIITLSKEETKKLEMDLATGFVIQLGSFSSKENSLKLRDKLRAKGFVTFVDSVLSNKKRNYRVRIGPFVSEKDAKANKQKIKRVMNIDGIIKAHELQEVID